MRRALLGETIIEKHHQRIALLAQCAGNELLALAEENNVNFLFEASVGGGIPIIRPIIQCLSANEIEEVAGILNGTTNYILTKMFMQGTAYEDALADPSHMHERPFTTRIRRPDEVKAARKPVVKYDFGD